MGDIIGYNGTNESRMASWLAMLDMKRVIRELSERDEGKYHIAIKGDKEVLKVLKDEYLGRQ